MRTITTDNTEKRDDWDPQQQWKQHRVKESERQQCLHDLCPQCGGSGQKRNGGGMCIHALSCPCPKCSPR